MSSINEEELAKIMTPGLRVVRGRDWQECMSTLACEFPNRSVDEDGNGEGTIINLAYGNVKKSCYVKWDHDGSEFYYPQGHEGFFCLKGATKPLKKLPEMLFKAKEFVDAKIICEGKTFDCHKNVLSC